MRRSESGGAPFHLLLPAGEEFSIVKADIDRAVRDVYVYDNL